ncbi:glycosyltransferase [Fundidesulfovibrio putealis]|uniref:glycosyltransferase n=1 Tax=Fundidesulfovibrio putealis TaxID=270496 RepID=UPI0004257CEB|nr:glycosyltransferase [Fundidesulfovibrio putealis]
MASTLPENIVWGPAAIEKSRHDRRKLLEDNACRREKWISDNKYYYDYISRLIKHIIVPGRSVLNYRCETGFFLNAVSPSKGVGVEISPAMVDIARQHYPGLDFVCGDPQDHPVQDPFDYVLLNNISDTPDVLQVLKNAREQCHSQSRLVLYTYNYLWQPVLEWASRKGLRMPTLEPNWLSVDDLRCFLGLAGFELLKTYRVVLAPKKIPFLSTLANRYLARVPLLSRLCMSVVLVARPIPKPVAPSEVTVSVVIPCKNEQANVASAVERIPHMGKHTEIVFCDDKSTDGTGEEVLRVSALHPEKDIRLIPGPGICKAQNVWTGFRAAKGDVLMILDGDLAVMPEELPGFLNALTEGHGEFINGSRMIYPMQGQAMKYANFFGNKVFSMMFTLLFGHYIKDTLCGTKVLWRKDFERIEAFIGTWGIEDLWGDFDLLFGASRLHLKVHDLPVHYQDRIYGSTKMKRVFWNGYRMLRMWWAAWKTLRQSYY